MVLTTLNYLCTGYLNIIFFVEFTYQANQYIQLSLYLILLGIFRLLHVNIKNFLPKFCSNPIITAELVNIGSHKYADDTWYIALDKCLCTVASSSHDGDTPIRTSF